MCYIGRGRVFKVGGIGCRGRREVSGVARFSVGVGWVFEVLGI